MLALFREKKVELKRVIYNGVEMSSNYSLYKNTSELTIISGSSRERLFLISLLSRQQHGDNNDLLFQVECLCHRNT